MRPKQARGASASVAASTIHRPPRTTVRRSFASPAPSEIREHEELELLDRRVPPLGVALRRGAPWTHGRNEKAARVPHLELPRRESRQRRDLARRVRLLEPHARRSAAAAPAKSFSVRPPSLWVEYVSVTRL